MADNEKKIEAAADKSASEKKAVEKKADKGPGFFSKIGKFLKSCWKELKKITWLSKENTIKYTAFVIVALVVLAAVIGAFDYLCAWIINTLGGLV